MKWSVLKGHSQLEVLDVDAEHKVCVLVHGPTPSYVPHGRVPRLLPVTSDDDDAAFATLRHLHRLRDTIIQDFIEGAANSCMRPQSRAMRTKTRPTGQIQHYLTGAHVDVDGGQGSKNASGRQGTTKMTIKAHIT